MTAITFDTLEYSKSLQEAGVPAAQADAFAKVQKKAFAEMAKSKELATKADLLAVRTELREDIYSVRTELRAEIANTKHELLKWIIGMAFAQMAFIFAVMSYMK